MFLIYLLVFYLMQKCHRTIGVSGLLFHRPLSLFGVLSVVGVGGFLLWVFLPLPNSIPERVFNNGVIEIYTICPVLCTFF